MERWRKLTGTALESPVPNDGGRRRGRERCYDRLTSFLKVAARARGRYVSFKHTRAVRVDKSDVPGGLPTCEQALFAFGSKRSRELEGSLRNTVSHHAKRRRAPER